MRKITPNKPITSAELVDLSLTKESIRGTRGLTSPRLRQRAVERDICPECGGALDTGWECNECGYDARHLVKAGKDGHRHE